MTFLVGKENIAWTDNMLRALFPFAFTCGLWYIDHWLAAFSIPTYICRYVSTFE